MWYHSWQWDQQLIRTCLNFKTENWVLLISALNLSPFRGCLPFPGFIYLKSSQNWAWHFANYFVSKKWSKLRQLMHSPGAYMARMINWTNFFPPVFIDSFAMWGDKSVEYQSNICLHLLICINVHSSMK